MKGNSIVKNGKTYYKVPNYDYVYRGTDGYYAYRLYNKNPAIDTFATKNPINGEKFTTARMAYDNRMKRLEELMRRRSKQSEEVTVDTVWNLMLESEQKSEGTIRKHTSVYNYHIKPVFGDTKIKDLSVGDINDLMARLYSEGDNTNGRESGYSYSFVESVLKWFYWFYNFGYSHDLISKEKFDKFFDGKKMPLKRKVSDDLELRVLTNEQIAQIFSLLKESDLYLPALIALTTGTRTSECFALCWNDVDFQNRKLRINKKIVQESDGKLVIKIPKTKQSNRFVDIPVVLLNALYNRKDQLKKAKESNPLLWEQNRGKVIDDRNMEHKLIDSPDFICVGTDGKYIKASAFTYWAKIIREKICPHIDGMEDFSFYTFRKTHISMMSNFLTELVLVKHTGHAKIDTIRKYYANRTEATDELIRQGVNNAGSQISSILNEIDKEVGKYEYYREENLPIESESFELLPDRMPDLETEGTDIEF